MQGARSTGRLVYGGDFAMGERILPEEVPIALSFNGTTQAVMMATPADLEDFAYGFALTEGIATADEVEEVIIARGDRGIDVQSWIVTSAEARLKDRRRTMAGPVGCGLCGIDSIEQALRELPPVETGPFRVKARDVLDAIAALPAHQPLHDRTRAAHCAAFWTPGGIIAAREDVGRHNALDKLAGHLTRNVRHTEQGAVVLTSRVSIDMVQKVAAIGSGVLIAVSAPTADAVALADHLGITLIGLARPERFELFTHPERLQDSTFPEVSHVR